MEEPTIETQVAAALAGDSAALDAVLARIKDDIYGLAIRMLMHPADAEDATQEILLRVVTRLSTFEGRSRFRTWVYRLAVRALLNVKRGRAEPPALSFEDFGADLALGLQAGAPAGLADAERTRLRTEVRIACTQAMLLCLDRDHRIAYLLGVVFELTGEEAAASLELPAATYRKRLSRARSRVEQFTRAHCGLVGEQAPCSCEGRIAPALAADRVNPAGLLFAEHPVAHAGTREAAVLAEGLSGLCTSGDLMRANPAYLAPERLLAKLRARMSEPARG